MVICRLRSEGFDRRCHRQARTLLGGQYVPPNGYIICPVLVTLYHECNDHLIICILYGNLERDWDERQLLACITFSVGFETKAKLCIPLRYYTASDSKAADQGMECVSPD
jgi:hypothetical protein